MKKWGIFVVLLCCGIMVNAAKVALIPAAPELSTVADQVLAAMSEDSGIEFLERADIETILNERKLTAAGLTGTNLIDLGKTIHADLFAVITAKPVPKGKVGAAVSGLIVYDTRNGFRLVNAALSEQDAAKDIVERLRRARDITKHPEKQILLSIVTVRDAGVPERFKYQQAFIAAELQRRLGGVPSVIMLERDYLDNVNQERKITGEVFRLAPSARLLRLEFSPGSSPEIVNMTLRVTDAAGKELFSFNLDNCLDNPQATVMKTITAISEYLKTSQPDITVSASAEAARYFTEYQFLNRLGDYPAARRKLDAAIALDPEKLEYRLAILALNKDENYVGRSPRQAIDAIAKNLELCKEIERDFPGCRNLYSYDYFDWHLDNKRQYLNRQDRAELAKLADIYRPEFLKSIQRQFYKFNLSDGINSFEEWSMYNRYCVDMGRFYLYWDENCWCDVNYKIALKNLKISRDFFRKYPNSSGRDAAADWLSGMITEYGTAESGWNYACPLPNIEIKRAIENMLRNSKDYIDQGADHPLASVRLCALKLDLLRKTVLSNYNEPDFRKNMREYAAKSKGRPDDYIVISFVRFGNPALEKTVLDIRREIIAVPAAQSVNNDSAKPKPSMTDLLNIVRKEATPEGKARKALELAPQLQQYVKLSFTDPEVRDFFLEIQRLIEQYSRRENNDQFFSRLENTMNSNVDIKLIISLDSTKVIKPKNNQYKICIKNAFYQNGNLYLLLGCSEVPYLVRQNCWSIAKLDMVTGNFKLVSEWSPWQEITSRNSTGLSLTAFAVANKMAAVGNEASIYLFPLVDGNVKEIKDLPGKSVMALAILDGRVYAFVGQSNGIVANEIVLFSCKFDGSDRQIHISPSRDNKQNNMDREKPFLVNSMIADKKRNRLIFNCSSPNGSGNVNGLWDFNLSTNTGKCLFNRQWKPIDPIMTAVDNRVFFSFFHEDHCIYDLAADKGEVFFSTANTAARNYLKVKFRPSQGIFYFSPFFARDNQIWFGGDCGLKLITLPDASKSPLIFMPYQMLLNNSRLIFPHPDGASVIVVGSDSIYKVTPKTP